jgi:ribosomal protein S18 acetylase RimI-like enzyme
MNNNIIRPAIAKDIPQLVKLYKNVKEVVLLKHQKYDKKYFLHFIKQKSLLALVAEEKGKITGACVAEFEDIHAQTFLNAIVVHTQHRGKGISGMLFREVEKYAKKKKHKAVIFLVYDWNKHMQTVVEHYKYKKIGTMHVYGREF